MSTRREFLRSIPTLSIGFVLPVISEKTQAQQPGLNREVGIQLWTLRDALKEDLTGTLEALKEAGYSGIEAFGFDGAFYGHSAIEFNSICAGIGLRIYSSHTAITFGNARYIAEKGAEAGLGYLVLPSMMGRAQNTADDYRKTAYEMNQIGEVCKKFNICFGYHNHDFEFKPIDGLLPYDILLHETDPSLVSFQLDIYWVIKAGADPIHYFKKHPGRFRTWHIKDMGRDGESCIIGNGKIDFKNLLAYAGEAGLDRIFVEQEHYSEGLPLYCAEQSLRYIQSNLF
ncbi:MAG: sugar phosphate isomerase/epimerase [Bacteroidales bacterium]|nr:sugar phosphate isomerase/epimerase [Bacteroidales bacterium]MDZ4204896.1 sugar phosphate isomerase/epimerase [Bacteroidales bacterium]